MHRRSWAVLTVALFLATCSPAKSATWQEYREAGQKARSEGHYNEAEKAFAAALAEAEKFGPNDHRLAVALGNLGGVYWAQGNEVQNRPRNSFTATAPTTIGRTWGMCSG